VTAHKRGTATTKLLPGATAWRGAILIAGAFQAPRYSVAIAHTPWSSRLAAAAGVLDIDIDVGNGKCDSPCRYADADS
jgi:hypothetical protein